MGRGVHEGVSEGQGSIIAGAGTGAEFKDRGSCGARAEVRGKEAVTNPCTSSCSEPSARELLRIPHEALASAWVPKTLNRLQPGWSVERSKWLENMILPRFDYAFDNHQLLVSVVAHLLQQCGPLIGRGRWSKPPQR